MSNDPAASNSRPIAHPEDLAVDRFAIAMKARLAAQRVGTQTDWCDPARADVKDLTAKLMNAIAAGHAIDIAVRCMQLDERDARPTVLGGAWYACSTARGELTDGVQPAPPATLFAALMDLYWQAKLANDESVGELEPVFEPEIEVITRLLDGDMFIAQATRPAIHADTVEAGVVASLVTLQSVAEARTLLREVPAHVADKTRLALDRLLGELAAARAAYCAVASS